MFLSLTNIKKSFGQGDSRVEVLKGIYLSIVICPLSARSMPPIIFSKVDFPDPEGPRRTQNSPFSIERSMPFKTSLCYNR